MDCQQLRERIESVTLRSPDDPRNKEVSQHLQDCSNCRAEFQEHQEVWLLLSAALPPSPVSQELEDRVMQRVINAPEPTREYSLKAKVWKYAMAAAVLFLLVSGTIFRLGLVGQGQPKVTDTDIEQMRSIAKQISKLNELERVFAAPQLRYVSLRTEPDKPRCYLIKDPMSKQIHFLGRNLQVSKGSKLWIWLLSKDDGVLAASPIDLTSMTGTGGALFSESQDKEVAFALITQEPEAVDPDTPSKNVLLRDRVRFGE